MPAEGFFKRLVRFIIDRLLRLKIRRINIRRKVKYFYTNGQQPHPQVNEMNGKAQDYTPSLLLKKKITIFATGNHAVIVMEKDYKTKDIIEYIVAIISDFAERYKLTDRQAYRYLKFHGAIPFLKDYYGIIHTLDFNEAVESVAQYCRREGGKL